jgi:hypothetical protein
MINLGSLEDCYVTLPNGKKVISIAMLYQNGVGASGILKVPVDQYFVQSNGAPTALTIPAVKDEYTITVDTPGIFSIGDLVYLTHPSNFYTAEVLNVAGSVLTLDNPLTFAFPISPTNVSSFSREMTVDGSVTPQIFSIEGPGASGVTLNTVRLIMTCLTASAVDLSKFGDIVGGLTRGCVLRGVPNPSSGAEASINWNVKTNADLAALAYDWDPRAATNPAQGQDGFKWRYTWGGKDKHDAAPFLNVGDRIDYIIQDNLTTISELRLLYGGNTERAA